MRGLFASLEGDAHKWFDRLPRSSITRYDVFTEKLKHEWSVKLDGRFLLNQLFEIKKKENEFVHEFSLRFEKLVASIPNNIRPPQQGVLIHYLNAYEGYLGYH